MTFYNITTKTNRNMHDAATTFRTTEDLDTATKIFFSRLQSIRRGDNTTSHIVLEAIDVLAGMSKNLVTFDGYYDDYEAYDEACEKLGNLIVDEDWDWNALYNDV